MPATFLIGSLAAGGVSSPGVARAALTWFAVEYLVYQARYQWNDVRGFRADQSHPDSASRGRLPGPAERARRNIAFSRGVAVVRLALACGLGLLLADGAARACLYGATVGVLLVAVVYELLRTAGTGKMAVTEGSRPRLAVVGIWLVSGAGYAVRGITGLALAVDLSSHPWLGVAAAIALWSGGVAFVTSRWAIESLAFAEVVDGRVRWRASAEQAREHLVLLARWLATGGREELTTSDLSSWPALQLGSRWSAPWNVASAVGAVSAVVTGLALAETVLEGSTSDVGVGTVGRAVAVGTIPSAITVALQLVSRRQRLSDVGGGLKRVSRLLTDPISAGRRYRIGNNLAPKRGAELGFGASKSLAERAQS